MRLYLVRHGEARPDAEDAARPLTERGRQAIERVGQAAFVRQQTAIMNRKDSREDLAAIKIPTLVLAGRQDALCPPKVQDEMMARLPDAKLVLVEDCGHLAPLERPEATTAVFRYWLA